MDSDHTAHREGTPLADQLRAIRRAAFLTQKELADKLELSETCIGMWERGKRTPSLPSLRRLADALPDQRDGIAALAAGMARPPLSSRAA